METLFQLILILALLKYCLKAGFFSSWRGILFYSLFAGIIALAFYPLIILLESKAFEKVLSNPGQVANIAVLITFEALGGLLVSIAMLDNLFAERKRKWKKILKLTPGVLMIAAVFYIELKVFSNFPGRPFPLLAALTAVSLSASIGLISWGIKKGMPDVEGRYELKFLTNVLLLILAVVLNAALYGSAPARAPQVALLFQTLGFLALAMAGAFAGMVIYRIKRK
ncbi:MAG: hypothetical protein CSA96_01335 [Bacteroidetes bacterium]|nr:MAG: hypothetical protein CSA96_01335 [Bacteroidota bacterium]